MKYSFPLYPSPDVQEHPPDESSSNAVQQKTFKHSSERIALMNIAFIGDKKKIWAAERSMLFFVSRWRIANRHNKFSTAVGYGSITVFLQKHILVFKGGDRVVACLC